MMKALYFPFTQIDRARALFLAGHFGRLAVLNPAPETVPTATAALATENLIELRFAASVSGADLMSTLQDFHRWATAHAGGDLAALHRRFRQTPFFDSHSAPRILAELRAGQKNDDPQDPAAKLHQALLFLLMAQELDSSQRDLADDLSRTAAREKEMLALLSGEDNHTAAPSPACLPTPPGGDSDYMLAERLQAWARLALASGVADDADAPWLLTDHGSVLEQLLESLGGEILLDRHPLPATTWPPQVDCLWPDWLAQAAAAPQRPPLPDMPSGGAQDGKGAGYLTLVRISGWAVGPCLATLAGERRERAAALEADPTAARTLVGCVTAAKPQP